MKAILMLDMPQTCGECQLGRFLNKEDFEDNAYICSAHTYKMGEDVASLTGKPSWCPLRPAPLFLCDRAGCTGDPCHDECKHTTDIRHAVNFKEITDGLYTEKERKPSGSIVRFNLDGSGGQLYINTSSVKYLKIGGRFLELEYKADGITRRYLLKEPMPEGAEI